MTRILDINTKARTIILKQSSIFQAGVEMWFFKWVRQQKAV